MRWLVLVAVAAACSGGGGGSAALLEQEPNDAPGSALSLGPLVRAVVDGRVDSAVDVDYVSFTAPEHGMFVAHLDLQAVADFDLALFDGARVATARGPAARTESLYATVRAGRTYHLEINGFSGATGGYRLTLEIAPDPMPGAPAPGSASASPVGPLATPRSFHATVALPDGRALVAGGTLDPSSQVDAVLNAIASTEIFQGTGFVAGPALSAARFGPAGTLLPGGQVLIAGGDLGGTADLFDGDTVVAAGIPMTGGIRVLATATLLVDGRVLLAGGTTIVFNPLPSAQTLATTTIFDPRTRTFAAGPDLQAPRASHAAVRVADGRVLMTGGVGRDDSEWIDAAATASSPGPDLTGVRDDHAATLLADGRVLLTGGQDASGRSLATAEVLEAAAFRALAAPMGERRADHQALRLPSGHVLILGGEDDPAGGPDVILAAVEFFDPATGSFTPMPPLGVGRDDHRVVRLADGRILVTGGEDEASVSIADVETYRAR